MLIAQFSNSSEGGYVRREGNRIEVYGPKGKKVYSVDELEKVMASIEAKGYKKAMFYLKVDRSKLS